MGNEEEEEEEEVSVRSVPPDNRQENQCGRLMERQRERETSCSLDLKSSSKVLRFQPDQQGLEIYQAMQKVASDNEEHKQKQHM